MNTKQTTAEQELEKWEKIFELWFEEWFARDKKWFKKMPVRWVKAFISQTIQSEREKVRETIEEYFSIDEENGMDYYWISCSEWKVLKKKLAQKEKST